MTAAIHGLDSLSAACYTLPWHPRKRAKKNVTTVPSDPHTGTSPFPVLEEFEANSVPSQLRYRGYLASVRALEGLFERCVQNVYAPLFSDLEAFLHPHAGGVAGPDVLAPSDLFIPGFDPSQSGMEAERATKALRTAFLISSSTPALSSLSQRLVNHISMSAQTHRGAPSALTVTLTQDECNNVTTAIRMLVARFMAQGDTLYPEMNDSRGAQIETGPVGGKTDADLRALKVWYLGKFTPQAAASQATPASRPNLVLHLPSIEAIEPGVLSDLLLSLQAFSLDLDYSLPSSGHGSSASSTLILILGISSPSGAAPSGGRSGSSAAAAPAPWSVYIPRATLQGMDFSRLALPNKEGVWMELVQTFLTSRHLPVALGRNTFEFVRQAYWEKDADLDAILDAVRLAIFGHFSGKAISAFATLSEAPDSLVADPSCWTPKMHAMLRLALLNPDGGDGLWLANMELHQADEADPTAWVRRLMHDDAFLLQQVVQLRQHRDLLAYRQEVMIKFLAQGFQSLHKLDTASSVQRRPTTLDGFMQQREAEMTSSMLTLVVAQCLQASSGALDANRHSAPLVLSLSNGLTKLCTAARRLQVRDFETLVDDFVLFAEIEVGLLEASSEEAEDATSRNAPQNPPRVSSDTLALEEMDRFLSTLRTFQQRLTQMIVASGDDLVGRSFEQLDDDDDEAGDRGQEGTNASMEDDAERRARLEKLRLERERRRQERISRVQRRLEAEEKVVSLKREVTDWIANQVQTLLNWDALTDGQSGSNGVVGLIKDIWWHDSFDSIASLLDPCPRAGLLQPLHDPHAFLEALTGLGDAESGTAAGKSAADQADRRIPDVSRAYQLYRDCGKFVNLADWYEAFRQSLEGEESNVLRDPNQASAPLWTRQKQATGRSTHRKNSDPQEDLGEAEEEEEDEEEEGDEDDEQDDDDLVSAMPSTRRSTRAANAARSAPKRSFADLADDDDDSEDDYNEVLDTPSKRRSARERHGGDASREGRTPLRPGRLGLPPHSTASSASGSADVQARFALALNELARMGLLRGTRRKNEHVTKVVWDLVPE